MKTFQSYNELWKRYAEQENSGRQLTANKILNGRAYGPNGWEDLKIASELRNRICLELCDVIGGRKKDLVHTRLYYAHVYHWALDRLILNKRLDNTFYWSYCAGQDYPRELGELRRYLYSL